MMTPKEGGKPLLNAVGQPEPETEQPVEPFQPGRPVGERQDGPGAAPRHHDRHDALPPGSTAARRAGVDVGQVDPAKHRNS